MTEEKNQKKRQVGRRDNRRDTKIHVQKMNDSHEREQEKKIRYLNKQKTRSTKEQPDKLTTSRKLIVTVA